VKTNIERRNIKAAKLSVRGSATGNGKTLVGRVAYNSRSEDMGFIEVLQPRCFAESLKTNEVFAYWSHDSSQVLARQANGTLRLKDTPSALKFEADLDPSTTWGANGIAALKRGDVTANSFGFSVAPDGSGDDWEVLPDGTILRTIRKANLYEVSPVSVPAYSANVAGIRASIQNAPAAIRERLLRDADGITDADCDCDCDSCTQDDCENCSTEDCDSERCLDCPNQEAASRSHLLTVITRKLSLI
jgi:hypothetical protein